MKNKFFNILLTAAVLATSITATGCTNDKESGAVTLTNVSYDPTRELYEAYNKELQS